jgi:ABC-type spermidine/putrescine transport system permease subunit II
MYRRGLVGFSLLVVAFLTAPILIVIPMSLSAGAFLQFPPPGWSFQWYRAIFSDPEWTGAMLRSAEVGLIASVLALSAGTSAAYALARGRFRAKGAIQAVLLLPMIVPSIVFAVGAYLIALRLDFVGSVWLLASAHAVLALPYVVLTVGASLRTTDHRLELVAQTLGASRFGAFRLVTLPLIAPALLSGVVITLILSLDETVVALFLTGDLSPTLPVRVYNSIRYELDPVVPVAGTLVIVATLMIGGIGVAIRRLIVRHTHIARPEHISMQQLSEPSG